MTLKDLLLVLMAAGSGGLVYWLMETVAWFKALPAMWKRFLSLALSGAIPVLAWLFGVAMLYWLEPIGWRAWIEAIFAVAAGGMFTSQILHGALKLPMSEAERGAELTAAYEQGVASVGKAPPVGYAATRARG
jgi:hypothetical protein